MNPLNKILLGIGAFVALVIIVAFVWLSLANAHLKTQLAQSQSLGTACIIANRDFASKTTQQNKAVVALQKAGLAREKKAQRAAFEAQRTVRAYTLAADKLRKLKITGDQCVAAQNLFQDYLGARP